MKKPPSLTAQEVKRLTGVTPQVWLKMSATDRLRKGYEAAAIAARRASDKAAVDEAIG